MGIRFQRKKSRWRFCESQGCECFFFNPLKTNECPVKINGWFRDIRSFSRIVNRGCRFVPKKHFRKQSRRHRWCLYGSTYWFPTRVFFGQIGNQHPFDPTKYYGHTWDLSWIFWGILKVIFSKSTPIFQENYVPHPDIAHPETAIPLANYERNPIFFKPQRVKVAFRGVFQLGVLVHNLGNWKGSTKFPPFFDGPFYGAKARQKPIFRICGSIFWIHRGIPDDMMPVELHHLGRMKKFTRRIRWYIRFENILGFPRSNARNWGWDGHQILRESGCVDLRDHHHYLQLHPPKQTWNLNMDPWKRRFLLEATISRFHVNFWWCIIPD